LVAPLCGGSYGVKPDTAKPPLKSLQIREDEVAAGLASAADVDGVRMTMFYYASDLNNHSSGHFDWAYTEADKCHKPFGGPTWCMTENMANATCAPPPHRTHTTRPEPSHCTTPRRAAHLAAAATDDTWL
jgi:hypothetical protein